MTDAKNLSDQRRKLGQMIAKLTTCNPGEMARSLREQRGYTVEQLAEQLGFEHEAVLDFEELGFLDRLEASQAWTDCADEEGADVVERYFAILKPTAEEETVLRYNRGDDLATAFSALKEMLDLDDEPPEDPRDKPAKRR
ncbi:MAG: hypothetical protein OEZ06_31430 [Myxococcales bacterium]|nr:hypothetical protein [Myxococcales bacterium]